MAEWSDGRLDEFARRMDERFDHGEERIVQLEVSFNERFARVDERFDRVDARFVQFERSVNERFVRLERRLDERFVEVDRRLRVVDRRFDKVDREFVRVNDRLDDLAKILIVGFISMTGGILAGFGAMIVLIATQL